MPLPTRVCGSVAQANRPVGAVAAEDLNVDHILDIVNGDVSLMLGNGDGDVDLNDFGGIQAEAF